MVDSRGRNGRGIIRPLEQHRRLAGRRHIIRSGPTGRDAAPGKILRVEGIPLSTSRSRSWMAGRAVPFGHGGRVEAFVEGAGGKLRGLGCGGSGDRDRDEGDVACFHGSEIEYNVAFHQGNRRRSAWVWFFPEQPDEFRLSPNEKLPLGTCFQDRGEFAFGSVRLISARCAARCNWFRHPRAPYRCPLHGRRGPKRSWCR